MNYVRCPMNIDGLKVRDIASTHIQVWNSDGVWLLPERKWWDLKELYRESQVSEGRPYSKGVCQLDKEWASPGMVKVWHLAHRQGCLIFFSQSSPLDIPLPLCVPNNSNPKRGWISECRNKNCTADFKQCCPGRAHICVGIPQQTK